MIGFDHSAMPNSARCRAVFLASFPGLVSCIFPGTGFLHLSRDWHRRLVKYSHQTAGWVRIRTVFRIPFPCKYHGQTNILSTCCLSRSERQIVGIFRRRYASREQRQASLLDTVVDQDTLKRNILVVANAIAKYIHPKAAAFDAAKVEVRIHVEA